MILVYSVLWFLVDALFYLLPPLLMYWLAWQKPRLAKAQAALFALAYGYVLGNLATHLKWDFRGACVRAIDTPTPAQLNSVIGDGANIVFWLLAGWIPVALYVGLWWLLLNRLCAGRRAVS